MTLQQTVREQMKDALRKREALRLEVLRGMLAAFTNELVAKRRPPQEVLGDDDAIVVLKRLVKQRKDSAEQFTGGGRPELAEKEKKELLIIEEFLPKAMSREEIKKIALAKKAELGITDKSGLGKFIGAVMKECKGAADGSDVKAVVEELLA
ncbi:MAG: GatB/YqeY domain-containing protein [bacterium]|nr:GatB/YqeY domain-containing protein [bacterium]